MFTGGYYPNSYYPPSYFPKDLPSVTPKTGKGKAVGGKKRYVQWILDEAARADRENLERVLRAKAKIAEEKEIKRQAFEKEIAEQIAHQGRIVAALSMILAET